mmetsp:Transcript_53383/g.127700  ORF Transcript_53383/g.127700 Transcript_53383/m.127700 type:complete len:1270 (+) Transcript_53383:42-3851(+)
MAPEAHVPADVPATRGAHSMNRLRLRREDFAFGSLLGEGAFARVLRARHDDGSEYAIKMVDKKMIQVQNRVEGVLMERSMLLSLDHPGIVQLHFAFQDEWALYFGLELAVGGELAAQIQRRGRCPLSFAQFYAAEIVSILAYLREQRVAHRDLKPENLLLDSEGHLKLVDFDSAVRVPEAEADDGKPVSFAGTALYVAPEMLLGTAKAHEACALDLWALGCIIYLMLLGETPFHDASEYLIFQRIQQGDYTFPENEHIEAKDLIEALLAPEPQRRPCEGELQRHAFFGGEAGFAELSRQQPPPTITRLSRVSYGSSTETDFECSCSSAECTPEVGQSFMAKHAEVLMSEEARAAFSDSDEEPEVMAFAATLSTELPEEPEEPEKPAAQESKESEEDSRQVITFNTEAQKLEITATLQGMDFFSTLDTFSFERLISLFSKKFWRRNEQLLVEGKPAKAMHVVLQGDVNIIIGEKVLNKLGPKCILGERSVLNSGSGDAAPCGATVTAASAVVITLSASRNSLLDLFIKDAGILEHFHKRFEVERDRRGVTSFRNVKLFREADPSFTQALEVAVKERVFHPGDSLLVEGVHCSEAVMLCRGTVNILTKEVKVASLTVAEMPDAMIFGEFTLLGLWPFPRATIAAETQCLVQVIQADALRRCLDKYPDESFIFRELVEARLNKIYEQEDLARSLTTGPDEGDSNNEEAKSEQARPEKRRQIPQGLREVQGFQFSPKCLRELESYLHKRLFIPDQVIMQQGTDLQDVYVLQQGNCESLIFNMVFEIFDSPCVLGGLPSVLTKKVFTTVVARATCFVVKISHRHFTAIFEKYQDDRKKLFASANRAFSQMCDDFQQNAWIAEAMRQQLAAMPCLHGASHGFLVALAEAVEPRLLLPAQEIFLSSSSKENGTDLYFVFEGHFHCLQKGAVVGTISPKMLFGILEVFGITDISGNMRIRSDEICKVGVLTKVKLANLLRDFPEERGKFEKLVHNLMEDSVNHHLVNLPFFSGLSNQQILTVCHLLDRRFLLPDVTVVREGDGGDFMVVLNCGKAQIFHKGSKMGMLLAGKAMGVSQMMGVHPRYHATLKTISTCHLLLIYWHMVSGLIISAADLVWVEAMRRHAQEIEELELARFSRKLHSLNHSRSRRTLADTLDIASSPWSLQDVFLQWHAVVAERQRSKCLSPAATKELPSSSEKRSPGRRGSLAAADKECTKAALKPLRFRRDMKLVELRSQKVRQIPLLGRLDVWKGQTAPVWLQAARKELARKADVQRRS